MDSVCHDFHLACPTINLLNNRGTYCEGEKDAERCQACLQSQPDLRGVDITEWRTAHAAFVRNARFLIAPSAWTARMFSHYFEGVPVRVVPHGVDMPDAGSEALPSALLLPRDGHHSIGVLGAIGPVKGARQLEQLVTRSRERGLPIRWVVIGYTDRQFQPYQSADAMLTVHGSYAPRHLQALLDHYRIDFTVFPSAGPETFCYTLSESWAAGRPALVPPIGALHERMQASGAGWIMRDWQDMDEILDEVVSIVDSRNATELAEKQQLAEKVRIDSVQDMIRATERVYTETGLGKALVYATLNRNTMYAALLAAQGDSALPATAANRHLLKLINFGLRFRYTALGRRLYRLVPVRWQQAVKRRLLEHGKRD